MPKYLSAIYTETGLRAIITSSLDTKLLCLQRFVRFIGYGSTTLVLTLFLTALGHSTEKTGLFMTLTLLGDVVISLILTVVADKIGRRRMLALGALLMTGSGVAFALFSQYWILVLASIIGVISPSGNEIGPFKAIEESTISQLVNSKDRSSVIAWYTLFGTAGAATGYMVIGWVIYSLQHTHHWSVVDSYRMVFWLYAALGLVMVGLTFLLSSQCEVEAARTPRDKSGERQPLLGDNTASSDGPSDATPQKSRGISSLLPDISRKTAFLVLKLCFLFALDSLGSGIASNSWLVYFFHNKFGLDEGKLGSLFFSTNIISSASNLVAASLARRLGLVKTMVFTHLPASLILSVISLPSDKGIAMALLLIRASITSMDQAPRQAFLAAAVLPEERTSVMGIVNVCRTLSQAGGPVITGLFDSIGHFGTAFILAGALKSSYDVLMLGMFLGYKTVEEQAEEIVESEIEREREEGIDQNLEEP